MNKIIVLSLFDGLSGARIALDKLNIPCDYYASEIDKYAIQVSKKNYPYIIQLGDIKNIIYLNGTLSLFHNYGTNYVPKIDLFIGGSPCQDLSVAKKDRQGLNGVRSGLFYDYVRLLKECNPRYFLLKNVNSMPKESKKIISEILGVEPIMINSALVSAQNRKRLYWTNIPGVTQPEDKGIYLKDILEEDVDEKYFITVNHLNAMKKCKSNFKERDINKKTTTLTSTYYKIPLDGSYIKNTPIRIGELDKDGQGDRVYSTEGKSVNLNANGGGWGAKTGLYHIPHGYIKEKYEEINKYPTLCGQSPDSKHLLNDKSNIRKLTPLECERLQTLPDNYTSMGINEKGQEVKISDTQRYKMIGNGFTADVIKHILSFAKWD